METKEIARIVRRAAVGQMPETARAELAVDFAVELRNESEDFDTEAFLLDCVGGPGGKSEDRVHRAYKRRTGVDSWTV